MNEVQTIIGHHAALAALYNHKRIIFSLKCTREFYEKNKKQIDLRGIKTLEVVSRKFLDQETKNNFHQGVLLKCRHLEKYNLQSIDSDENTILILDSLNDSQNVGAILRSAYLFGIKSIIYNRDNSFDINSFLVKSASGAYEKVKLIEVTNLSRAIGTLKTMNFWILGLDLESNRSLESISKDIKMAIIFGSESKGIRSLIKKNCDYLAKIDLPIKDKLIDSLNVSNSVSIVLFNFLKK